MQDEQGKSSTNRGISINQTIKRRCKKPIKHKDFITLSLFCISKNNVFTYYLHQNKNKFAKSEDVKEVVGKASIANNRSQQNSYQTPKPELGRDENGIQPTSSII